MTDATKERVLSLDAKIIAATNIAVARAIWQTHFQQQKGEPINSAEKIVRGEVIQAVKEVEDLAKQIVADIKPVKVPSAQSF